MHYIICIHPGICNRYTKAPASPCVPSWVPCSRLRPQQTDCQYPLSSNRSCAVGSHQVLGFFACLSMDLSVMWGLPFSSPCLLSLLDFGIANWIIAWMYAWALASLLSCLAFSLASFFNSLATTADICFFDGPLRFLPLLSLPFFVLGFLSRPLLNSFFCSLVSSLYSAFVCHRFSQCFLSLRLCLIPRLPLQLKISEPQVIS